MYNSKYQGFTSYEPSAYAETGVGSVSIYWDDAAENSSDVLTGYYDFEDTRFTELRWWFHWGLLR